MNLRTRFNLLLLLLCMGLALSLAILRLYEQRETRFILQEVRQQQNQMLDRLIDLNGRSLATFAHDYSLWTEMTGFVSRPKPDLAWSAVNIDASLANFGAQAAWVFKPDGSLFHAVAAPGTTLPPLTSLPSGAQLAERLGRDKYCHFFISSPGGIHEIRGAVIVPSEDIRRESPPRGYFLTARVWDAAQLRTLGELSRTEIELNPPEEEFEPAVKGAVLNYFRPLRSWNGGTLRVAHARYESATVGFVIDTDFWEALILFGYGAIAIGIGVFFVHRWVLRPLRHISDSLATGELAPLEPVFALRSEFARVAQLVRTSFHDRETLRRTLDERAQLSRDLHDGQIQSLYAIGMNLASIGPLVRKQPAAAEEMLDTVRAELNASIRELRSFISRLAPAAERRDFLQAVRQLVDFMQAGHTANFRLEIAEALGTGLPAEHNTQLLFIVREALSNALRHAHAGEVVVRLQPDPAGAILEVRDDGRGFDPAAPRTGGHGLDNMTERALQLSGTIEVHSQPRHGTTVTIRFPLPP